MKSKQILTYLNISPLTLRNYIQYINEQYSHLFIIESSSAGYRLKKIENNETIQPENKPFENRMYFILQRLVLARNGVDIFDLSDELFVSVPTIEKDLIECRKFIKSYDLAIERAKDYLFLRGKEIDKRKIMRVIYTKEYNTTFYNIIDLEKSFGYELGDFKKSCCKLFKVTIMILMNIPLAILSIILLFPLNECRIINMCIIMSILLKKNSFQ